MHASMQHIHTYVQTYIQHHIDYTYTQHRASQRSHIHTYIQHHIDHTYVHAYSIASLHIHTYIHTCIQRHIDYTYIHAYSIASCTHTYIHTASRLCSSLACARISLHVIVFHELFHFFFTYPIASNRVPHTISCFFSLYLILHLIASNRIPRTISGGLVHTDCRVSLL